MELYFGAMEYWWDSTEAMKVEGRTRYAIKYAGGGILCSRKSHIHP